MLLVHSPVKESALYCWSQMCFLGARISVFSSLLHFLNVSNWELFLNSELSDYELQAKHCLSAMTLLAVS